MPLDREIQRASALVIDGNITSRSILAAQLRDLGVGQVVQVSRLGDARRKLETRAYDVVVCEQHFPDEEQTGQELLDDLRRAGLLPHATVFVMITGEARYAQVAEAAESALDSYLLKPFAAQALADRLHQARRRKRVLKDVFEALEAGDFERAAEACLARFRARGEFWLYAARIGAELLLRLGRHAEAQAMYQEIVKAKTVPWARLGVARAQLESGQTTAAQRTLDTLVAADPGFADAYDVMGRVQLEQGRFDEALETYRLAAQVTPGSIARLQKVGMLAFYLQAFDEAERCLDRATLTGISSKTYDPQTLVLLAFTRLRQKDAKGLQRCRDNLQHLAGRDGADPRLDGMLQVVQVLCDLSDKQLSAAVAGVQALAKEIDGDALDVESACNLVALLATLIACELELGDTDRWVDALALRFAGSRGVNELMLRSAALHPPLAERVQAAQASLLSLSEASLAHALEGRPDRALPSLLEHARATRNLKLVDTALRTLGRYRDRIAEAEELQQQVDALQQRLAAAAAAPRMGQGARAAGGVSLRDGSPARATLAREGGAAADAPLRTDSPAPPAALAA